MIALMQERASGRLVDLSFPLDRHGGSEYRAFTLMRRGKMHLPVHQVQSPTVGHSALGRDDSVGTVGRRPDGSGHGKRAAFHKRGFLPVQVIGLLQLETFLFVVEG